MTLKLLYKCVILALYFEMFSTNTIKIYERENPSVGECKANLVNEREQLIYYSTIDMSEGYHHFDTVQYEIKRHDSNYEPLCFLDLKKCKGYRWAYCYCSETADKDVFTAVVNVTAELHLHEATLRGRLLYGDGDTVSEERKLPKIYDPQKIETTLYINDQLKNATDCNVTVHNKMTNIFLVVNNKLDVVCQLEITDHNKGVTQSSETNVLSYTANVTEKTIITLTYSVCKLPEYNHSFSCSIKTAPSSFEQNTCGKSSDDVWIKFWIVLAVSATEGLLLLASFMCIHKRRGNVNKDLDFTESKKCVLRSSTSTEMESLYSNSTEDSKTLKAKLEK
ncbi:uncharacterized protein LOC129922865 isoform X2 [Biomphalaria glabrata]|nr:uncharacterized protein LOC129922865 isoform X2 [Biomphalaria glabrata]XP_055866746.1 uncharacterized protein LOC129922865 isoform X2 [Biomphalaria glabrata]XP_055866747.1 uncharacterized protein LOC129922865 isoform X2 [Biomphalaria glabrata]XP_055866748.1 uncharacterized protein LOC129922865 isoform X2 [Biomphalaria glabrata]XP_055866749.1 uncharacterized protein LOC129922865 isoform X2 [Biomphalaria glabrata]XP_055866750.1 uncharacterized protein LOC129922865 isoform X2 [Biomphalaria gla